jgi:hypothetical protein
LAGVGSENISNISERIKRLICLWPRFWLGKEFLREGFVTPSVSDLLHLTSDQYWSNIGQTDPKPSKV